MSLADQGNWFEGTERVGDRSCEAEDEEALEVGDQVFDVGK